MILTAVASACTTTKSPAQKTRPSQSTALPAADIQLVHIEGGDGLRFSPATVTIKPGAVRIVFAVVGRMPHTFTSRALNVDSGNVPPGHSKTIDFIVPRPGKYSFYSSYEKQRMTGTLIAKL
jgi:plastocyanin